MFFRLVKNDIQRNKVVTLTILFFIVLASLFSTLAFSMTNSLFNSIDNLMDVAQTPHLLYMHSGDIDLERMNSFVDSRNEIVDFQILEMVNIESIDIQSNGHDLSDSIQDNGFVVQSDRFDYLLDENNEIITVLKNEVFVPIYYLENNDFEIGDTLTVKGIDLIIKGFARDSQMNSPLSSSKRFLVHESVLNQLEENGHKEYLIEFRTKDTSSINDLQQAYIQQGLEANGPPGITYPLFRMINMISDGLLIALLGLVGFLVLLITFLSLRFSLLAQLEEDTREIAIMKAIGMTLFDIRKLYLVKISFLALIGGLLGYFLANVIEPTLLKQILLNTGGNKTVVSYWLGLLGALVVMLVTLLYSYKTLGQIKKISVHQALRSSVKTSKQRLNKRLKLSISNMKSQWLYSLKELLFDSKHYRTMLIILVVSLSLVIIPSGVFTTLNADDFMRNLGVGDGDIRIDLNHSSISQQQIIELEKSLLQDERVDEIVRYVNVNVDVLRDDHEVERMLLTLGNHELFPIEVIEGNMPSDDHEIALSSLQADELEKSVGDSLSIVDDDKIMKLTISGIYSDITSGGKTAKASFSAEGLSASNTSVMLSVKDKELIPEVKSELQSELRNSKVIEIDEFRVQTFGSTVNSIGQATILALIVMISLSVLITLLFNKMMLNKNRREISIQWSLGISLREVKKQILLKNLFIGILSIFLSIIISFLMKDVIGGSILALFGASSISIQYNGWWVLIFLPLMMIISIVIATMITTRQLKQFKEAL